MTISRRQRRLHATGRLLRTLRHRLPPVTARGSRVVGAADPDGRHAHAVDADRPAAFRAAKGPSRGRDGDSRSRPRPFGTSVPAAMRVHVAFTPAEEVAAPVGIVVDVFARRRRSRRRSARATARPLLLRGRGGARGGAAEGDAVLGGEREHRAHRRLRLRQLAAGVSRARRRHGRPDDDERHAPAARCGLALRRRARRLAPQPRAPSSRRLAQRRSSDVAVLCAGVQGELALDDAYCAGRIAAALDGDPADSAAAAMRLAETFAARTRPASARPRARGTSMRAASTRTSPGARRRASSTSSRVSRAWSARPRKLR